MKSLPRFIALVLVLFTAVVLAPQAQTVAPTDAALVQKVSYLTQRVHQLEEQLRACSAGQGVTCPAAQPAETTEAAPPTPTYSTHSQPARRPTMGYQQASDSRLGCDDYSLAYFRRHPAMAAVCGVNAQQQPATPQPQVQPLVDDENVDPEAPVQP